MALGSEAVLVAERTALLFAVWLAALVIALQAWRGHLPVEVSGQGVKYADAAAGQQFIDEVRTAVRRHDAEIRAVRVEIDDVKRHRRGRRDGLSWARWHP